MKLILTGDWHIRETKPVCRLDDYWQTQWEKIDWITDLAKKYNCPVLHSGDLFHHWKPSPYLLSMCIEHLPRYFFTVYGNHDLPQHSLSLAEKSGINVLAASGRITVLEGTHFGEEPVTDSFKGILVWHVMTYKNELPFPGCEELSARAILKKYPQYKLILTGDNHVTFVQELKDRILINPGSIFRWTASQIDHRPCVFLYDTEKHTYEQIFLPIAGPDVISREHIDIIEKRNNRIDAFVSGLTTDMDMDISFTKNLSRFYVKNKIDKNIRQIIQRFIEV